MKVALRIAYDGRDFFGYQRQAHHRTVQAELEQVLEFLFQEKIRLHASGRTDAGVHALSQVAAFSATKTIQVEALQRALSRMLPKDIQLMGITECPEDFHPRFDAIGKHYRYVVSSNDDLFGRPYVHYVRDGLDLQKMREAVRPLIGVKDFAAFSNRRKGEGDTKRDLWAIEIHTEGEKTVLDFYADGFLYKMVRILTQYLLHVGLGKISPQKGEEILHSRSRELTRLVAPPQGLYLRDVYYAKDPFQPSLCQGAC